MSKIAVFKIKPMGGDTKTSGTYESIATTIL